MKRKPRPSLVRTAVPALATLLSQCSREPARYAPNPPGPTNLPPPPATLDAGSGQSLEPVRIDPNNIPPVPLAGAPMPITPLPAPPPSPAPSAMAPSAMAPSAPAPATAAAAGAAVVADGRAPGLYIVHNHPPGTPCRPLSQTELRQVAQHAGITR